ncbi:hypothetical protein K439DRAFT_829717 [Ramaria rubella]|nr:hypothetical protein K439DRAFT_829717 [Ramaria rubella]
MPSLALVILHPSSTGLSLLLNLLCVILGSIPWGEPTLHLITSSPDSGWFQSKQSKSILHSLNNETTTNGATTFQ